MKYFQSRNKIDIPANELFPITGSMLRTFKLATALNAIPMAVKDTINSFLFTPEFTSITEAPIKYI
jgi:hypothetical protein